MSLNQDQHYIDKVLNGNVGSFAVLIDRYKHMVYTLAMKILNTKEEAEEVSQDVFVKAYQMLPSFKGDSKFSTWLYRIAYNRSLDYLKKRGRRLTTSSIDTDKDYYLDSMDNILDQMQREEHNVIIKNALGELSEVDTVIITLHYFEELSLKEISKVVGLKVNAVKVRLFRSRKQLAQILQHKLEPEIIEGYGRK
ncbi:RNA polymerase sigma factor [Flagellimonas eckloniae]|uniref:RNA polymerase n=1 Tax=Flagellimonas eckloniae TaxID=346185 RepID=A0A0Q1CFT2_9FLAO|nr:sigma-70 family RNA polymerase sigma factor [Allomuricauda eckloniae]KQC29615.1 RNA polymerase [Allomuricauda eckloniae]